MLSRDQCYSSQNDIMAIAAAEVAAKLVYARDIYGDRRGSIYVLGTDAMTGKGGGVEAILQGKIDASITYASRGDMVIQTAVKILNNEPYLRDTILPIMLVDPDPTRPDTPCWLIPQWQRQCN